MGLDMYLNRKQYIGAKWEHRKVSGFPTSIMIEGKPVPIEAGRISFIEYQEVYWRKANQLHNWFVINVQDGVDECQQAYVAREALQTLRDLCAQILSNHELAPELLPAADGFFFGSTEYDEYYFQDLKHTVTELDRILNNPDYKHHDFYYQSSW